VTIPIWNPDVPAVSWVADESGLAAWQEAGTGWQEFPASVEEAQEILGRPAPTWGHLSSAELLEVAQAVTAPKKSAKRTAKSKTTQDAPEDQPQEAAEHDDTEGETG